MTRPQLYRKNGKVHWRLKNYGTLIIDNSKQFTSARTAKVNILSSKKLFESLSYFDIDKGFKGV